MDVLTTTCPLHLRRIGMTDEEFMKQIEQEWSRIDDDPDMFDELAFFEDLLTDD
jgi:hypothetical protein